MDTGRYVSFLATTRIRADPLTSRQGPRCVVSMSIGRARVWEEEGGGSRRRQGPCCVVSTLDAHELLLQSAGGRPVHLSLVRDRHAYFAPSVLEAPRHQMHEEECTWKKYVVLANVVDKMRVRDKRHLFHLMRTLPGVTHDTLFTKYGMTAGEFATWQVLSDNTRKRSDRE